MRHPHRLRWVPDQVGHDWRRRNAVIIFGSAYGPFIGGDGRPHEIDPIDYDCDSSSEMITKFFRRVISCRRYYNEIAKLASEVIPSCRLLALVDLCRVAFVLRDAARDIGGDAVVNSAPELFTRYVESEPATSWLWRRIIESEASALVALGTIAEHGLLRLFARHLPNVSIRDSQNAVIRFDANAGDSQWPGRYAHQQRKLRHRQIAKVPPYWKIEGKMPDGSCRTWRVAVVPHPTGARRTTTAYSALALRSVYDVSVS